jgi:hypothetical protein
MRNAGMNDSTGKSSVTMWAFFLTASVMFTITTSFILLKFSYSVTDPKEIFIATGKAISEIL